jgi:hypothetical protein
MMVVSANTFLRDGNCTVNDQLPITYEEMRGLVVEVLTSFPDGQASSLDDKVAALAAARGCVSDPQAAPAPFAGNPFRHGVLAADNG